jgi:hypothetical protein
MTRVEKSTVDEPRRVRVFAPTRIKKGRVSTVHIHGIRPDDARAIMQLHATREFGKSYRLSEAGEARVMPKMHGAGG